MSSVDTEIQTVETQADADLAAIKTAADLEAFRVKYLGTKGILKSMMQLLGKAAKEEKPALGQKLNALNTRIKTGFDDKQASLADTPKDIPGVDLTEPGLRPQLGRRHILMQVVNELTDLFARMGFAVASGPEVEDDFHNFIALNIPQSHPARDPLDNFYLSTATGEGAAPSNSGDENLRLLRTQTSTVQIRVMETQTPPIRVVIPGRVYRPDTHDDTHLSQFHQLEALVIEKGVTFVDLKSAILQFVHAYFGPSTRVRFRPSFFPFTEPSAEVDVWFDDKNRWIELGGCGMVHPNVLRSGNIDPEEYAGWAFGFGIERIAMRKYGINNIRLFVENDVRFLGQF